MSESGDANREEPVVIDCVFRSQIEDDGSEITAECGLIQAIAKTSCRISEQVCRICGGGSIEEAIRSNRVLPSLVFDACGRRLDQLSCQSPDERKRLERMRRVSEQDLLMDSYEGMRPRTTWTFDVIMTIPEVEEGDARLELMLRSVRSVLDQRTARAVVHLVGGKTAGFLAEKIGNPRQVMWHQVALQHSLGKQMHQVIEHLHSEFVAWQHPLATSEPLRIREALEGIWLSGSEFWMAPIKLGGREMAVHSVDEFATHQIKPEASVAMQTLVCRRASLVDLDGFADRDDALLDLVQRAIDQDRHMTFGSNLAMSGPQCEIDCPDRSAELGRPMGFAFSEIACDIALPFHNHLDYVQESLEALLEQERADVTIHLVDDCSTENTVEFMSRWKLEPRVKCYRNRSNIGQFMSLNNVSEFCDTGLIAVQDADDVSLPHRVVTAGNFLRLCGADYFGGAVELFGDDNIIRPIHSETNRLEVIERTEKRYSFFPPAMRIPYFLENPTAVFRRDMFRQRGGYADFGTREMNRSSLDSEFLLRCFFSGVRFAITKQMITRYRVHQDSATQNRVTGWGTGPRAEASRIVYENTRLFRQGNFDPRVFGSIGKYSSETERLSSDS
ncbi:MAG: glycosyltransferase family 2 protein [Rubripirellula sp.]